MAPPPQPEEMRLSPLTLAFFVHASLAVLIYGIGSKKKKKKKRKISGELACLASCKYASGTCRLNHLDDMTLTQVNEELGNNAADFRLSNIQINSRPANHVHEKVELGPKVWTKSKSTKSVERNAWNNISNLNMNVTSRDDNNSRKSISVLKDTIGASKGKGKIILSGRTVGATNSVPTQINNWDDHYEPEGENGELTISAPANLAMNEMKAWTYLKALGFAIILPEFMNIVCWNVRCAACASFKSNVDNLIRTHHMDILFIYEPRISVYASPCGSKRAQLWDYMSFVARSHNLPWLLAGDFNEILSIEDKFGGASTLRVRGFKNWFDGNDMVDLGFSGPKFTWTMPTSFRKTG
ncbi:unnamed protein product [Prunus armeniaca]